MSLFIMREELVHLVAFELAMRAGELHFRAAWAAENFAQTFHSHVIQQTMPVMVSFLAFFATIRAESIFRPLVPVQHVRF